MKMNRSEEIRENIETIYTALDNLRKIYFSDKSTIWDMNTVLEYAELFNKMDVERFITG